MSDQKVLTEVPEALKLLVRYVTVGFYQTECALVMDLLVHHPGIKEDDLLNLIKFDRKQLRSNINTLKQDLFINSKIQMETGPDGKATRHNYYYINYSTFVNVVKYKLDHVRRKIETMERDSTMRASFHCPSCHKSFTDLETGQLFDLCTGTYKCTYCSTEVEEEVNTASSCDSRTVMVKFNEQMQPIYSLLQELDGIKLSDAILEPPLRESKNSRPSGSGGQRNPGEKMSWSGDATKHVDYGFVETDVTINLDANGRDMASTSKPVAETPIWMKESTVENPSASALPTASSSASLRSISSKDANSGRPDSEDIMRTLLSHEKSASNAVNGIDNNDNDDQNSPSSHNDNDDDMESDEEEAVVMVAIGGEKFAYNDVTPEMVLRMTQAEKDEYLRIGQELHDYFE